MWNRPVVTWLNEDADHYRSWDSDRTPSLRLGIMWVAFVIPLAAVAMRMGQLQIVLQDDYVQGFEQTYVVTEEIPARNGRILAVDGSVLAGEEERYDLQINYRLIQDPPDERWLRAEAARHLDRQSRKNPQTLDAEKKRILDRRDALWKAISLLTDCSPKTLASERSAIQARVTSMKQEVLRQRKIRQQKQPQSEPAGETGWQAVWNQVRKELTEPPTRSLDQEPLVEEVGYHTIVTGVSADVKAEIEAHRERYPGLRIDVQTRRIYPQHDLASHLIGNRLPLTAEEVRQQKINHPEDSATIGDSTGRSGLELKYDAHLRGIKGLRRVVKNRRGDVMSSEDVQAPRNGKDLVLTLDVEAQRCAEQLLDQALDVYTGPEVVDDESNRLVAGQPTCPQGGCLVAVDVQSGAIIAAASAPRFDLNLLNQPDASKWKDLMDDPRKPLFARATQMALAPGSVFKVLTAIAALESEVINPDVPIPCRGYLDRPDQYRCLIYRHHKAGHGDTRLSQALAQSCNVYFFTSARRMGPAPLVEWAARFGIGQPTGIDLPSEGKGRLPSPEEIVHGRRRKWHPGDTLGLAIGQMELLVTPLQMARAMAAVANGGYLVTPHLAGGTGPVSMAENSFRPVLSQLEPQEIEGLQSQTLAHIREGLEMVVNHPTGTAYKTVRMKEVRIAGKTGTAETNGADHAWFAGYAPADRPRIAFVVVLEHGGSGGKAAGPVARQFILNMLNLGLVTPTPTLAGE